MVPFALESSAFKANAEIPSQYTCDGSDISPPLRRKDAPQGTKSFAIIVDDPDAPDPQAPKMTWTHWVLYNIPSSVTDIPEGAGQQVKSAHGALNDWKAEGYRGPCPPIGKHHYHHKIYALDTTLPNSGIRDKAELETAMKGHVLAQAELVATYEKKH